jgi:hypothetical protein
MFKNLVFNLMMSAALVQTVPLVASHNCSCPSCNCDSCDCANGNHCDHCED